MGNKVLLGILVFLVIMLGATTGLFKDLTGYTTLRNSPPSTVLVSPGYDWVVHTNEITLEWDYKDLENDPQTAFIIQIDKSPEMKNSDYKTVTSPSNSYKLNIKGLEETTYYWRVKTRDNHGWGSWSLTSRFSVDLDIKECSDGTPLWQCSLSKPKWCYNVINTPILIDKCSKCGCPDGYKCQEDICQPVSCTDGTLNGKCSTDLPKYCDKGNLIYTCEKCGCLIGTACQPGGTCSNPIKL